MSLDRGDAGIPRLLAGVHLAGPYDLMIACLQVEVWPAIHRSFLLIALAQGRIFLYRCNAVLCCIFAGVCLAA